MESHSPEKPRATRRGVFSRRGVPIMFDVASIAAAFGLHPETVRRRIRAGELPAYRLGAVRSRWRVAAADFSAFLQGRGRFSVVSRTGLRWIRREARRPS